MADPSAILIVEKDPSLAQRLLTILGEAGIAGDVAPTAEAAQKRIGERPFALILLNLQQPDLSGLDLLQFVQKTSPDTTVVAYMTQFRYDLVMEAFKAGAFFYLTRPTHALEVRCVVARALERLRLSKGAALPMPAVGQELGPLRDQLVRAKEEYLSLISHELRNPLTAVIGFASTTLMNFDRLKPAQARANLDVIHATALRLSRLIDEMTELCGIEANRLFLEKGTADLEALAKEAFAQHGAQSPGVALELSIPAEARSVVSDPAKLGRLLGLLLENAVRYSPENGKVKVKASRGPRELFLTVHDDGAVVSEEEREKIFEAFQRRPDHGDRKIPETGLGLAIARGLAGILGGRLWVEPTAAGCQFALSLPLQSAASASPARSASFI